MLATFARQLVPAEIRGWCRERILALYGVAHSRYGLPAALVKYFQNRTNLVLIDIGASEGHFTGSFAKSCGLRKALLIEPLAHRCHQLTNRFGNGRIQVVCAAVADCEKEVELEVLEYDYCTSLFTIKRSDPSLAGTQDFSVKRRVKTKVFPLDTICATGGFLEKIDLLKIDAQGAEGLILAGAGETLTRVEAIWTEVSFRPLYDGSITFTGLCDTCREHGFILHALEEGFRGSDGELLQGDALFVRGAPRVPTN